MKKRVIIIFRHEFGQSNKLEVWKTSEGIHYVNDPEFSDSDYDNDSESNEKLEERKDEEKLIKPFEFPNVEESSSTTRMESIYKSLYVPYINSSIYKRCFAAIVALLHFEEFSGCLLCDMSEESDSFNDTYNEWFSFTDKKGLGDPNEDFNVIRYKWVTTQYKLDKMTPVDFMKKLRSLFD